MNQHGLCSLRPAAKPPPSVPRGLRLILATAIAQPEQNQPQLQQREQRDGGEIESVGQHQLPAMLNGKGLAGHSVIGQDEDHACERQRCATQNYPAGGDQDKYPFFNRKRHYCEVVWHGQDALHAE